MLLKQLLWRYIFPAIFFISINPISHKTPFSYFHYYNISDVNQQLLINNLAYRGFNFIKFLAAYAVDF